jgi:hypothetical protein
MDRVIAEKSKGKDPAPDAGKLNSRCRACKEVQPGLLTFLNGVGLLSLALV